MHNYADVINISDDLINPLAHMHSTVALLSLLDGSLYIDY